MHVHGAVVAHHATGRLALDLRDGDVFWCPADPGWVTGISYGVVSSLTHGAMLRGPPLGGDDRLSDFTVDHATTSSSTAGSPWTSST